ncbi:TauD/TfdA family dioxygenase [Roseomonas sp. E05]|uniref:TauD/TfdA family dioxygenase n=1 Tax=Roseomonas sp. E05 TaxID=3046310 RepID=UPI0024B8EAB3|nr:TauD/TfdA family dioxygenase [Roseomonas sp. E05]MDJ0388701.1 TauD/TfdA family dioxygenase [Roseomonas sp. E05]
MPILDAIQEIAIDPARLPAALAALPTGDPCCDPVGLHAEAGDAIQGALSQDDAITLRQFATGQQPWLVIRTGINLAALPETPTGFAPLHHPAWWPLAWATIGLMSLAGARLVSYHSENDGAAFVNLVALPDQEAGAGVAERSVAPMRGHTDGASLPFPSEFMAGGEEQSPAPDLLVLVGLRNPSGTMTRLTSVSSVLRTLTDEQYDALQGPWFDIKAQRTFVNGRTRVGAPLLSLVEPRHGNSMRFSHSSVRVSHDAPPLAREALDAFSAALPGLYTDVVVGAGDICLVHNRQVIHGRAAPGPGVGGHTRWLLRTYGWMSDTTGNQRPGDPAHLHL